MPFLMLLPKGAYYATSNPNRDFYFFSLSFLKVCFHAILNKSKDIVFHVNSPPPAFYLPLIEFKLQSLAISARYYYQAAVFPLAYASSIVLDNSFCKYSAVIFQYIFFSNLNMVIRSSNRALRPPRLYDHLLPQFTSHIGFPPSHEKFRVILLF